MAETSTVRRIYVACLASYNSGKLHGEWIDADQNAEEIQEEVSAMLRKSPYPNVEVECPECEGTDEDCSECRSSGKVSSAEEWAIHDHEGFYGHVDEYTSFERVAELAELFDRLGEAYAAYMGHVGDDYATESDFEDAYNGVHDSETAYAESLIDDLYNLDEMMGNLACYFDYERFARDLFINDYSSEPSEGGGVHVFRR